jgi:hypothetical protein
MTGPGDSGAEVAAVTGSAERDAARLRDRLAEIEVEQATLEAELAAFNADYMREVMTVMLDVQELEARILALLATRSGSEGDAEAARSARERVRETTAHIRAVPKAPGPVPTGDIKRLFREAAKRMHPDLAGDEGTRGHAEAFMKRLNQAYKTGDAEAIADLLRQWEASPFGAGGEDDAARAARAERRVGALADAVARAQQRLDELRASELAQLMERAMAATAAGGDLLAELRAAALAALVAARARLAQLEAGDGR